MVILVVIIQLATLRDGIEYNKEVQVGQPNCRSGAVQIREESASSPQIICM